MFRRILHLFFNDHCVWCRNLFCGTLTIVTVWQLGKAANYMFSISLTAGLAFCAIGIVACFAIGRWADR